MDLQEEINHIKEKIQNLTQREKILGNDILVRYILKELMLYFMIAFLFFFMVFFCNQMLLLAENILKKRVPLWKVIKLITYCLPFIIAQSAPFATLVGFLMCLGRMMTDNEVLILRASGQSYKIILIPVMALGLGISVFSFFVNDYLLPLGTIKYHQLYKEILTSNPAVELEPNSVKRMSGSTLVIGDVDGTKVSDVVFIDKGSDGRDRIIISGNSDIINTSKEGVLMQMNMNDSNVIFFDANDSGTYDVLQSNKLTLNIFDSAVFGSSSGTSPGEMTAIDLNKEIKRMESDEMTSKRTLNIYKMEFNKKFSLPFGSIFFAMLALSLAFLFGKHNGQTIGLIIGLIICVLYWAMMILGQIFSSRNGWNGFWSMWYPNIIIGVTGVLLYLVLLKK